MTYKITFAIIRVNPRFIIHYDTPSLWKIYSYPGIIYELHT